MVTADRQTGENMKYKARVPLPESMVKIIEIMQAHGGIEKILDYEAIVELEADDEYSLALLVEELGHELWTTGYYGSTRVKINRPKKKD